MLNFINKTFAALKSAEQAAMGGVKGRLAALTAGIESDVERLHRTIQTVESGLEADIRRVESAVVAEAARLHGMIHGQYAPSDTLPEKPEDSVTVAQ